MTRAEHVVLVHGLYMNRWVLKPMGDYLEREGYPCSRLGYSTTRATLDENLDRLRDLVDDIDADRIHFVGHSLGGLLIRHFFDRWPEQKPGVVVTLGTPHQAAEIAHWIEDRNLGGMLGTSRDKGLLEPPGPWRSENPLGSIAGIAPLGPLPVLTGDDAPSDGTVRVAETRLDGMADHCVISGMHSALMFSSQAFQQVLAFIQHQKFLENL